MSRPDPVALACPVGDVGISGVTNLVADLFVVPESLPDHPIVMICVPGGGISRRYYDLRVPSAVGDYSMARHLARRGHIVVTIDPPGVGDSDVPDDGYALTPSVVAEMLSGAATHIVSGLRRGRLTDHLDAQPGLVAIGVGHSAGGLLTVVQQDHHRSYRAVALLGFGGAGLPEFLNDEERRCAGDPAGLRTVVASLTAARFGEPLPVLANATSELLVKPSPPPEVLSALGEATAPLLGLVGLTAIVPGSVGDSMARIDVPVFVGIGEHDIASSPHAIAAELPASMDLTLFGLAGAGHNHNVAAGRARLWDRLSAWANSLFPTIVHIEEPSA